MATNSGSARRGWRTRAMTLLPGLARLRHYDRARHLRGDLLGGVTVTAYLVPQVMAYATLAGLSAQVGLWTMIVTMALYALFGSSRLLSVGPESTTALLTAAALAPLAAGDGGRYAGLAALLALLVGGICLLAWLFRMGFLADLLSKPVLVGYMAGVAVIMISSQLGKITGVPVRGDTFVDQMRSFADAVRVHGVSMPTLVLGTSVTVFLLLTARRFPRVPMPLVAVGLAAFAAWALQLSERGVGTVGAVPAGLPTVGLPTFSVSDASVLILPAIGITVVGYADVMLTGRTFAMRHHHRIDANTELLAMSAANVGTAFVGGYPVSASGSRTVIAEASGARTQVYSLVAIGGVLVTVLFLGGLLAAFPSAALGGLVVYAALRLIDVAEFRRLWSFRYREFGIAIGATFGVLALGILYGVLFAIGLSVADLLVRVARPHDGVLGQVPGLAGWHDVDDYPNAQQIPGLVVFRYDSPLFFANAEDFVTKCLATVTEAEPPARWFLLNAEANVEVDITGLDALEQVRTECHRQGVVFALVRVKHDLEIPLEAHGIAARIGAEFMFPTFPVALAAYESWVRDHPTGGR